MGQTKAEKLDAAAENLVEGIMDSLRQQGMTDEEILKSLNLLDEGEGEENEDKKNEKQVDGSEYGKPVECPHYKTEECPLKDVYPEPGKVPEEAKNCKYSKEYNCPFILEGYKETGDGKDAGSEGSEDKTEGKDGSGKTETGAEEKKVDLATMIKNLFEESLKEQVEKEVGLLLQKKYNEDLVKKSIEPITESQQDLASKVDTLISKTEELVTRVKSVEDAAATKKSLDDEETTDNQTSDEWASIFPPVFR